VVDARSRFVYVANLGDSTVSMYRIDADGFLSAIATPMGVSRPPYGLATEPSGRYLYVACSDGGGDEIDAFAIGSDGQLTLVGPPLPVGSGARAIATSVDGRFVYVVQSGAPARSGLRARWAPSG
jgi:6-phosphogluconolactonase (cycloisomerase 2 family)